MQRLVPYWSARFKPRDRRIISIMLTVGLLNFGVKAMVGVRDMLIAYQFGTSEAVDAYLLAATPILFVTGTFGVAFADAYLPVLVSSMHQRGAVTARDLFSNASVASGILQGGTALLLGVGGLILLPQFASAIGPTKLALIRNMLFMLLPSLFITGFATVFAPTLYANGKFALAAVAPMLTPVAGVLLLLGAVPIGGPYVLAGGMVIGAALEATVLGLAARRQGFNVVPRLPRLDPELRRVLGQMLPLIGAACVGTTSVAVDQLFASMLGPGMVASLNYGNKVVLLVIGVGSLALSTALFPQFAHLMAELDDRALQALFRSYCIKVFAGSAVLATMLIVLSEPVVRILFERGEFTARDAVLVTQIQQVFLLQVPFHLAGMISVRLLNAAGKNHLLVGVGLVQLVVNAGADYILMHRIGVLGIALSTTLVFVTSFSLLMLAAWRVILQPRALRA